jgi:hypothetical protein
MDNAMIACLVLRLRRIQAELIRNRSHLHFKWNVLKVLNLNRKILNSLQEFLLSGKKAIANFSVTRYRWTVLNRYPRLRLGISTTE